jgi:cytochrome d ubiquinol oxidase subunit II
VGLLHPWAARTELPRRTVLASIGPVWDGNEVRLIAFGGLLFLAFRRSYAAGFSGFSLPLMMVLWLLIGRGIAIEWRHGLDDPMWKAPLDLLLFACSGLLPLTFGLAVGNVVRGVPLDPQGYYRGLVAWMLNPLRAADRRAQTDPASPPSGSVPRCSTTTGPRPPCWWCRCSWPGRWRRCGSPAAAITTSARSPALAASSPAGRGQAIGLYPYLLPSEPHPERGLSIANAASNSHSLAVGILWLSFGLTVVVSHMLFVYALFGGKVAESGTGALGRQVRLAAACQRGGEHRARAPLPAILAPRGCAARPRSSAPSKRHGQAEAPWDQRSSAARECSLPRRYA